MSSERRSFEVGDMDVLGHQEKWVVPLSGASPPERFKTQGFTPAPARASSIRIMKKRACFTPTLSGTPYAYTQE
jgi:hypothetical protein